MESGPLPCILNNVLMKVTVGAWRIMREKNNVDVLYVKYVLYKAGTLTSVVMQ